MSREDMRRYLICYDIKCDKRRSKVANALSGYGDRVQYSVFIVDCPPASLIGLRSSLRMLIDTSQDSVLICNLGLVSSMKPAIFSFLGKEREVTPNDVLIL